MSPLRQIVVLEFVSVGSLLLAASALAGYSFLDATSSNSVLTPFDSAKIAFGYTAIIGAPFVLLIGAPGYWVLLQYNKANLLFVSILGILPGTFLLFVAIDLGVFAIIGGGVIATLTHIVCSKLFLKGQPTQ